MRHLRIVCYNMISRVWFIYFYVVFFLLKLPYCIVILLVSNNPIFLFSHSIHHTHTQNGRDDDGGYYTFVLNNSFESLTLIRVPKNSQLIYFYRV